MSEDNPEEQIQSRLRELTAETRKLRRELEDMIRRPPERRRAVAHNRPRRKTANDDKGENS